jgi:predicted TPR repeat methyltransferase
MSSQRKKKPGKKGGSHKPAAGRVSVDETLQAAMQLHQRGFQAGDARLLAQAEDLYEGILIVDPDNADALHFLGVAVHHARKDPVATDYIRRAIELRPGQAAMWSNLGNVYREQGAPQEAAKAWAVALELSPGHADAHNNLGTLRKQTGDLDGAIASYRQAIALAPEHVGAHYNLANVLYHRGDAQASLEHYRVALSIDPKHGPSRSQLANVLYRLGRVQEALDALRELLKLQPDDAVALHMLAACSGEGVPPRASDRFVRKSFDDMAPTFEEHLGMLGYRAPSLIATLVQELCGAADRTLGVLDAGCGTGLCASALRQRASRLVGVDLSPGMLAKARSLGLYDELVEAELTGYIEATPGTWDLIVSADTLCYFGDLDPVLGACARSLRGRGLLLFTVERWQAPEAAYRLNPHSRYSHTESYVRQALQRAGLQVESLRTDVLRKERGEPVEGLIVAVRKIDAA